MEDLVTKHSGSVSAIGAKVRGRGVTLGAGRAVTAVSQVKCRAEQKQDKRKQ